MQELDTNKDATTKALVAEKSIDASCKSAGITKAGSQWVKTCLDPFSDVPEVCDGYPDLVNMPSVVQRIQRTTTQTVPPGVPPGANWDMLIVLNNNVNAHAIAPIAQDAQGNLDTTTAYAPQKIFGGLEVYAGPSGVVMGGAASRINLPIQDEYLNGSGRVIGMAFEVHDTTAEIQKSGSVIVFRQSARNNKPTIFNTFDSANPAKYGAVELFNEYFAFQTPQDAILQPFARQWAAKEGCYCVSTMNSNENSPIERETFGAIYRDPTAAGGYSVSMMSTNAVNNIVNVAQGPAVPTSNVIRAPFNLTCAYFTGLPNIGSYQINVKYIYESFPTAKENPQLAVLARPSPTFDATAMELYAKVAQQLPAGVMVKDNAAADWINAIATAVGNFVPGVKALGSFIAPTVGGWIDNALSSKPTPNKKNNNKPRTIVQRQGPRLTAGDVGAKEIEYEVVAPPNAFRKVDNTRIARGRDRLKRRQAIINRQK